MKPVAVLISDIHYNLQTLPLADAAMRQAIAKANELNVPLIVAGDLHDTKANLRAECVNAMIETFKLCENTCYILRGNHDSLNEKSKENSLDFLAKSSYELGVEIAVVNSYAYDADTDLHLVPYYHDSTELTRQLSFIPIGETLIMHQGLNGSASGEYIQDKSALNKEDLSGLQVISGHYHTRQHTTLPSGGTFNYIGNPYTLNYAEANDPEKGFQILMSDGSLQFVPTNLRKHVVLEVEHDDEINSQLSYYTAEDLIWLKIHGPRDVLVNFDKSTLIRNCRIEFIFDNYPPQLSGGYMADKLNNQQLLDSIIDNRTDVSEQGRSNIKQIWRDFNGNL